MHSDCAGHTPLNEERLEIPRNRDRQLAERADVPHLILHVLGPCGLREGLASEWDQFLFSPSLHLPVSLAPQFQEQIRDDQVQIQGVREDVRHHLFSV